MVYVKFAHFFLALVIKLKDRLKHRFRKKHSDGR